MPCVPWGLRLVCPLIYNDILFWVTLCRILQTGSTASYCFSWSRNCFFFYNYLVFMFWFQCQSFSFQSKEYICCEIPMFLDCSDADACRQYCSHGRMCAKLSALLSLLHSRGMFYLFLSFLKYGNRRQICSGQSQDCQFHSRHCLSVSHVRL